ncbi:MAG: hypothetical protein K1X81_04380 [Bacteroidia bacterium]|nr:hypothetical protein [Bacteroidia bacterium]
MNKIVTLLFIVFVAFRAQAQFGHQTKEILEKIKETELVVILSDDSTDMYNTSIQKAIHDYWKLTPAKFVKAAAATEYTKKKEGYTYLIMVKSAGAKVKCKCSTSELEMTGIVLTTKYKKGKIALTDIAASALIDGKFGATQEEYDAQFIRAVQFLTNFFDYVNDAENDKAIAYETMQRKYPGDKTLAEGKKLLIDKKMVDEKQKEAIEKTWDGEVEYVDAKEIAKAILTQNEEIVYWAAPMFELDTHRMFIMAKDGKIVFYEVTGPEKNMVSAKDVSRLMKK